MTSAEDRQAKALEGIERSAKELVKIFTTFNENFVAFSKQMQASDEAYTQAMAEKGPMMVLREDAVDQKTVDESRVVPDSKRHMANLRDMVEEDEHVCNDGCDPGGLDSTHYVEKGD